MNFLISTFQDQYPEIKLRNIALTFYHDSFEYEEEIIFLDSDEIFSIDEFIIDSKTRTLLEKLIDDMIMIKNMTINFERFS